MPNHSQPPSERTAPSRHWATPVIVALLGILLGATSAPAQLVVPSPPANPHYFTLNGVPIALVGVSGEYIPHVSDHNATWVNRRCRYDNGLTGTNYRAGEYKKCIDDYHLKGLNKIRMWIGLTFSPGFDEELGQPFPNEQPFFWNGSKWRLDRADTAFYGRVREVIAYCATKGIIVEVTLFAHSGDYNRGPYAAAKNFYFDVNGVRHDGVGFTSKSYVMSFDANYNKALPEPDADARNREMRRLQVTYVQRAVAELNSLTNFYWEIANEPDFNTVTLPTAIPAMIDWHNYIADKIVAAEGPLPNKHVIAANFITESAYQTIKGTSAALSPNIKVINGHYVDISPKDGTPPRLGAIKILRTYNRGTPAIAGKLFGFGETQISHDPNSRMSSRAEAWEFMLSEGGLYDNLNYAWNMPPPTGGTCDAACRATCCKFCNDSSHVRIDLGSLNNFLKAFNLPAMRREVGARPAFVTSGVPDYGTANTYWGGMQWAGNQYALYLHHSTLAADPGAKWYKPVTGNYTKQLTFSLTGAPIGQHFKVEWFVPPPCTLPSQNQTVVMQALRWDGVPVTLQSPPYTYDLAVRITRCPGTTACVP